MLHDAHGQLPGNSAENPVVLWNHFVSYFLLPALDSSLLKRDLRDPALYLLVLALNSHAPALYLHFLALNFHAPVPYFQVQARERPRVWSCHPGETSSPPPDLNWDHGLCSSAAHSLLPVLKRGSRPALPPAKPD